MKLEIGNSFPAFSLQDQDGKTHSNQDYAGKKYVVYFYPKDDTSGCTIEACEFRDSKVDFGNTPILGISPDSVDSHRKFADKFSLNFPLLADVDRQLAEACGVWVEKNNYGKKYMGIARTTFLIDENGKVEKIWKNVKPEGHADQVKSVALA